MVHVHEQANEPHMPLEGRCDGSHVMCTIQEASGTHQCTSVTTNFAQSTYIVCLGLYQLSVSNPDSVCSAVKRIIYNTLYTGTASLGDILLLELNTAVNFTDFIMPICLPNSIIDFPSGLNCWVTGWGDIASSTHLYYPKTMQEVMVPLIDQPTCDRLYHIGSSVSSMKPLILSDMICAGYVRGGKDSCQGDSGGPLVCAADDGTWFLTGIVSWGEGCAKANRPGVYTRVTAYTEWIQRYATNVTSHQGVFNVTSSSISSSFATTIGASVITKNKSNVLCSLLAFFLPFLLLILLKEF
ncbi:serine protease 27-like [Lissotriton helveticus]